MSEIATIQVPESLVVGTIIVPGDPAVATIEVPTPGEIAAIEVPEEPLIAVLVINRGPTGPPGVVGAPQRDEIVVGFSGQTVFPLSGSPVVGSAMVSINGLMQRQTEYVVAGGFVIFNSGTGITLGDTVIIFYLL